MDDLELSTTLGRIGRETPVQTARFAKRRLRDRWPDQVFSVRTNAPRKAITVTWTGGPSIEEVRQVTRHHSRDTAFEPMLWSSANGLCCLIEPGATITLRRSD